MRGDSVYLLFPFPYARTWRSGSSPWKSRLAASVREAMNLIWWLTSLITMAVGHIQTHTHRRGFFVSKSQGLRKPPLPLLVGFAESSITIAATPSQCLWFQLHRISVCAHLKTHVLFLCFSWAEPREHTSVSWAAVKEQNSCLIVCIPHCVFCCGSMCVSLTAVGVCLFPCAVLSDGLENGSDWFSALMLVYPQQLRSGPTSRGCPPPPPSIPLRLALPIHVFAGQQFAWQANW